MTIDCDFIAQWEVGPGSYLVVIRGGAATLGGVEDTEPAEPLDEERPCPHQGP